MKYYADRENKDSYLMEKKPKKNFLEYGMMLVDYGLV